MLDAFDISLPRGDSIGVAGALVAAAVQLIEPYQAIIIGVGAAAIVQAVRYLNGERHHGSINEVWIRLGSTLAAFGSAELLIDGVLERLTIFIVPMAFLLVEMAARQAALSWTSGRSFARLVSGNISRQALLYASEVSVSALTVMLYESMGVWTLIPVLALLVLIRQSYAMLLEIRETYHTTVAVLVDAAESPEPGRTGHSERTAEIARAIGSRCGLRAGELERLSYASLLHDVHGISGPSADARGRTGASAEVVQGVDFLADVVPILRVVDGFTTGLASERELTSAFIVALASDVDSADRPVLKDAHAENLVARLSGAIPAHIKARVVAAAVSLGYSVPAID
jgi:hypothetical protein